MNTTVANQGRLRKSHGDVLKEMMEVFNGLGVTPDRLMMERSENPDLKTRAFFDIIFFDKEENEEIIMFEGKTAEELKTISEGLKLFKYVLKNMLEKRPIEEIFNKDKLFDPPSELTLRSAIAKSFDDNIAEHLIPKPANNNSERNVMRQAASQVTEHREKDPKRVEQGRRAMFKRYSKPEVE